MRPEWVNSGGSPTIRRSHVAQGRDAFELTCSGIEKIQKVGFSLSRSNSRKSWPRSERTRGVE